MQIQVGSFYLAIKGKPTSQNWEHRTASEKITDMRSRLMLLHADQGRDLGATAENLQTSLQCTAVMKEENEKQNQSCKETKVEYK